MRAWKWVLLVVGVVAALTSLGEPTFFESGQGNRPDVRLFINAMNGFPRLDIMGYAEAPRRNEPFIRSGDLVCDSNVQSCVQLLVSTLPGSHDRPVYKQYRPSVGLGHCQLLDLVEPLLMPNLHNKRLGELNGLDVDGRSGSNINRVDLIRGCDSYVVNLDRRRSALKPQFEPRPLLLAHDGIGFCRVLRGFEGGGGGFSIELQCVPDQEDSLQANASGGDGKKRHEPLRDRVVRSEQTPIDAFGEWFPAVAFGLWGLGVWLAYRGAGWLIKPRDQYNSDDRRDGD